MKFLCSEKISQHKFKTPEGYLVCLNSVLARTGKQTYKRSEIFGCDCKDAESEVEVDRTAEEVFSDKTLASFENKPLTIEHPDEDVNVDNHRDLAVGFARDIKRGKDNGEDVMLGTLVFTDADAIEAIENGEMLELSCGYDADIVDEENPCQRNIRGNHIALCQRGRAGIARIVDSVEDMAKLSADEASTLKAMIEGGAGESLYNRLSFDKPTTVHLSQEDKELLRWHRDENQYLTNKEKALLKKLVGDSKVGDDKLSDLRVVLRSISSMQRRDLDIEDVIRTLRNAGFKSSVEKIDGWTANQNVPGEQIKNYTLNIEDLNKRILVTFYADMGKWKTKEINAYVVDSVKDNLELPEDEDSTFMYRDAYGKEIIVTNWDGRNVFLVEYDGTEQQMSRKDIEHYLDRKGARFSKVLRDSIKDEKWYDPEYSKYVTEDYIKRQYENFKKTPYFKQTYEKFREENFIEVKPGMERYYDSVEDAMPRVSQCSGYAIVPEQTFKQYGRNAFIEARADNLEEAKRMKIDFSKQYWNVNFVIVNCKTMKIEDSMKDGKLVEVPPSTIMAFEGKVNGANIHIDSKGRTWSGRLHYQLSYDASKASFNTFVKELEKLEDWLESIDIPVTFSAGNDGKLYTAGFDIDKQWVRDSVKDYDEDDDDDLSNAEKELCDYMLEHVYEKGMTPEQLLKKMESYYSMYQRLARHKPDDVKEYFKEQIRYGRYDSLKDVDTYEEVTKNLKKEAKKEMTDEWSGTFDGYIFSYNSKDDTYLITSPSGKQYRVRADKLTPQDAIKKVKLLKDSKEDILQKIRTTQIREGDVFEMRDGQYLVQIQNVGMQELSTRSGPYKSNGKNESLRLSVKLSSQAWGRIWKNGTIVFNETDKLNIVRDKMIQFLKTVRDSKMR